MTKAEQSLSRFFTIAPIRPTTCSTCAWLSMPGGPSFKVMHSMTGPPLMRSGSIAASMPLVTASVEFGLMTRMRSDLGSGMAPKMASKLLFNNG
jgi:hypothetical protein